VVDPVTKAGYQLAFEDTFDGNVLDESRWLPHHLRARATDDPRCMVALWMVRGYRPAAPGPERRAP